MDVKLVGPVVVQANEFFLNVPKKRLDMLFFMKKHPRFPLRAVAPTVARALTVSETNTELRPALNPRTLEAWGGFSGSLLQGVLPRRSRNVAHGCLS